MEKDVPYYFSEVSDLDLSEYGDMFQEVNIYLTNYKGGIDNWVILDVKFLDS